MLSTKHRRTLDRVFETPVRPDIRWTEVEAMLRALGADILEGSGSRVRVKLNERRMVFHRPHPQPTLVKDAVRSVRRFLTEAGVIP